MCSVIHVSKRVQEEIFKLLLALNEGRGDAIASLLPQIGLTKENFDAVGFRHIIEELVMISHSTAEDRLEIARVDIIDPNFDSRTFLKRIFQISCETTP